MPSQQVFGNYCIYLDYSIFKFGCNVPALSPFLNMCNVYKSSRIFDLCSRIFYPCSRIFDLCSRLFDLWETQAGWPLTGETKAGWPQTGETQAGWPQTGKTHHMQGDLKQERIRQDRQRIGEKTQNITSRFPTVLLSSLMMFFFEHFHEYILEVYQGSSRGPVYTPWSCYEGGNRKPKTTFGLKNTGKHWQLVFVCTPIYERRVFLLVLQQYFFQPAHFLAW